MFFDIFKAEDKKRGNSINENTWYDYSSAYKQYDSDIYAWNKKPDDYTEDEINDLDEKKLDYIYNSGISFLEQINESIKRQYARATLLIGYLLTVTTTAIGFFLQDGNFIPDKKVEFLALLLITGYSLLILSIAELIKGKYTNLAATYFQPKDFMTQEWSKRDLRLIKIDVIKTIQIVAEQNSSTSQKVAKKVGSYIVGSLAVPVFVAFSALAWEVWLIFACQACQF